MLLLHHHQHAAAAAAAVSPSDGVHFLSKGTAATAAAVVGEQSCDVDDEDGDDDRIDIEDDEDEDDDDDSDRDFRVVENRQTSIRRVTAARYSERERNSAASFHFHSIQIIFRPLNRASSYNLLLG